MLPSLNSGALRSLIRPRWIKLVAVQCLMLWSIPKTGGDLPPSRPTAIILSQETGQAFTRSAIDIDSVQEKSHGSKKVQSNRGADQGALRQRCQGGVSRRGSSNACGRTTEAALTCHMVIPAG